MSEELFKEAANAVLEGDTARAEKLAQKSLDKNLDPLKIIEKGFTPGIAEAGRLFDRGELFLPQLMSCANAMKAATTIVNEALGVESGAKEGTIRVVLGSVEGDLHDIGKGIVASLLEANGIEVIDLGTDVPVEKFVSEAEENDADIIGTSTLLTTTMKETEKLENYLKEKGLREKFKTIVGGAPVTERWVNKIGADAYAENANEAVDKIFELAKK